MPRLDGPRPCRPHHRPREHPDRPAARRTTLSRKGSRTSATSRGRSWRSVSMPAAACRWHDLLAEYRDVTEGAARALAGPAGFAARRDGPRASSVKSKFVPCSRIRVFDLWAHEQDFRTRARRAGWLRRDRGGAQSRADADGRGQRTFRNASPRRRGRRSLFDITGHGWSVRSITSTASVGDRAWMSPRFRPPPCGST